MYASVNGNNVLCELAQTMTASGRHSTATALRKLAHAGYTTLEQVDTTSDLILLSIPGMGTKRLGEVRRLSRSDWRPLSSQAIHAARWFLSAAQFALRYWPPDLLASLIRGSSLSAITRQSAEQRLVLDVFSQATRRAQRYCDAGELVRALWQVGSVHAESIRLVHEHSPNSDVQPHVLDSDQVETSTFVLPVVLPGEDNAVRDSDHFAHSRCKRIEIVRRYWIARDNREIKNKDAWARSQYQITGKTLLCYEREFQDQRQAILATASRGVELS